MKKINVAARLRSLLSLGRLMIVLRGQMQMAKNLILMPLIRTPKIRGIRQSKTFSMPMTILFLSTSSLRMTKHRARIRSLSFRLRTLEATQQRTPVGTRRVRANIWAVPHWKKEPILSKFNRNIKVKGPGTMENQRGRIP